MRRKHPENPVIAGSSRDPTQSYPPTVIKTDNTYFCIVKTEAADLVGYTSDNGINWEEASKHVLKRGITGWDQRKVSSPLLRYEPDDSTYHLYYSGMASDESKSIGYAVSDEPLSGYEKPSKNPICEPADINKELATEYDSIIVADLVRMDDEFIFYGTARSESDSVIWMAKGNDWTDISNFEKVLSQSDLDVGSFVQTPSVISVDDMYVMQFTAGENSEMLNEKRLYLAIGETPYDFDSRSDPTLSVASTLNL